MTPKHQIGTRNVKQFEKRGRQVSVGKEQMIDMTIQHLTSMCHAS